MSSPVCSSLRYKREKLVAVVVDDVVVAVVVVVVVAAAVSLRIDSSLLLHVCALYRGGQCRLAVTLQSSSRYIDGMWFADSLCLLVTTCRWLMSSW